MEVFKSMWLVGMGGFLGSSLRFLVYYLAERYWGNSFPWGTFIVNIAGCFLIGLLYGLWIRTSLSDTGSRIWIAGFCGGFTTFSAFSNDSLRLLQQNYLVAFMLYTSASVVLGLLATYTGWAIIRAAL